MQWIVGVSNQPLGRWTGWLGMVRIRPQGKPTNRCTPPWRAKAAIDHGSMASRLRTEYTRDCPGNTFDQEIAVRRFSSPETPPFGNRDSCCWLAFCLADPETRRCGAP